MNTSPNIVFVTFIPFVILVLLGLSQCTDPPNYPDEPVITFVSLSKDYMVQGFSTEDSLTITLSFTDGDANLGSNPNTDFQDIFIFDSRTLNAHDTLRLPEIPLEGAGNGVSGEIFIRTSTTCCLYLNEPLCGFSPPGAPDTDTLTFLIQIMDRDSNKSNIVETSPIVLGCIN